MSIALFAIILAAFLGGGIPVFIKIGLREISPLNFILIRFVLASLIMMPLFVREKVKITKDLYKIIFISLLATINVTFFTYGLNKTTATISQVLYSAVPIFASIFSYLLLKEKIGFRKIVGVIVGFIGVLLIIFLPILGKISPFKGSFVGNLLIFAGVLLFSLYSVLSKSLQKKYSPVYLTTVFSVTTTIVILFLSFKDIIYSPIWSKGFSTAAFSSVIYVGVLGTAGYYLLYQYAIKHGTPIIASVTFYLQPVSAFIWAVILLGERLTFGFLAGAISIMIGAWLVTRNDTL